ncbi:MAG: AzlC family ABC transporter permease [Merdibacter sp.]
MSTDLRNAFIKTIPIMCGYLFLGFAFGISLQQAGFGAGWALLISTIVYAGSLQFVLVPFLASGAPLVSVFLTSLFVNSRHIFYGLSFLERFRRMKQAYPYMVFSLTDETYSVLCAQKDVDALSDRELFFIHLLDQLYWIVGSLGGALVGSVLPFDFTGIDFAMTALFGVISMNRWNSGQPTASRGGHRLRSSVCCCLGRRTFCCRRWSARSSAYRCYGHGWERDRHERDAFAADVLVAHGRRS